ncbi:uncharacterized protein LOC119687034 [Teleopsis dalmanni]|uniref:uncharacterized protein LOC119687034 n=1 Tax=Teleopsis dalmanni TaxID=139649 RepID=UPI0018CEBA70|nr:uncharacterized protein LOC119687034 [Teleopsis dalmanni]
MEHEKVYLEYLKIYPNVTDYGSGTKVVGVPRFLDFLWKKWEDKYEWFEHLSGPFAYCFACDRIINIRYGFYRIRHEFSKKHKMAEIKYAKTRMRINSSIEEFKYPLIDDVDDVKINPIVDQTPYQSMS